MVATPIVRLLAALALTAVVGSVAACTSEGRDPISQGGDLTAEQAGPSDPAGDEGSRIEPPEPPAGPHSSSETNATWADLLLAFEVPAATYTKEVVLLSGEDGERSSRFAGEIDWKARLISDELSDEDSRIWMMRSDEAVYVRTGHPMDPCGGVWMELDPTDLVHVGLDIDPDDLVSFDLATILHDADPPTSSMLEPDGSTTFDVEVPGTVGSPGSSLIDADAEKIEELEALRNTVRVTLGPDGSVAATLDATRSAVTLRGSEAPDVRSFTVEWRFEAQESVGPLVEPVRAPRMSDCR